MDSYFIRKRYNPQVMALQLGDLAPEAKSVVLLRLHSDRIVHHSRAPFFFQVRPLAQDLLLKVFREAVFAHRPRLELTRLLICATALSTFLSSSCLPSSAEAFESSLSRRIHLPSRSMNMSSEVSSTPACGAWDWKQTSPMY